MINPLNIPLDADEDRAPACTDPLCAIHGTGREEPLDFGPDDYMGEPEVEQDADQDNEGGVPDPRAAKALEDALNSAFGQLFGGAVQAQVMNAPDTEPFLTTDEALFINSILMAFAAANLFGRTHKAELLYAGTQAGRIAQDIARQIQVNKRGSLVTDLANTSLYDTCEDIGQRMLKLSEDMHTGRTTGVFRAPF